jgi:hypothetical protein
MRGDYIDVTYRTGVGIVTHRVKAEAVGSGVGYMIPRQNDLFIEVQVTDRKKDHLLTAEFNKNDVVALVTGHEAFKSRKRARKAADS